MLNDAQFLHILAAEADHLVTVSIELSPLDNTKLQGEISRAFTSDGFSDVASAWNSQRTQIVEEVIEKHLIPVGAKYIREWLREEVEETLANKCADVLERVCPRILHIPKFVCSNPAFHQRVEGAAFRPNDFEKGEVPAVLALSWGKGDPQRDPIIAVFMDEAGRLREHARFDNLMDPGYRSEFTELLSRRKPDVIVVGGFTILATKLMDRVKEVVGYQDGQDHQVPAAAADDPWDAAPPTAGPSTSNANDKLVPVVWMPDQVARIYQHSKRAEEEFGSLPPLGRYCVGLARYAQSPVNEFAALGPDLVAITFHEDQHLVSLVCLLDTMLVILPPISVL
jgi:transcription elongation factor SPT6